jgi:hypothetical protein
MKLLASFVMRGRSQAVMLAAVLAMVALLVPPVSILSTAVVALVTLRKGPYEGLLLVFFAAVACALLGLVAVGAVFQVVGFVLFLWLPAWLLSMVLRSSRSLALTLEVGLLLGLLIIAGQYFQSEDPVAAWREVLAPLVQSLEEAQVLEPGQQKALLEALAGWMPGVLAAGFFLQTMVALLLARWWQALLYNPGGFRAEFQQLRIHRPVAVVTLLVLILRLWSGGPGGNLVVYLSMLLMAGWFLQGMALTHGLVARARASIGWLVGVYLLLLFAMPQAVLVLAVFGFADSWIDLRARLQNKGGAG